MTRLFTLLCTAVLLAAAAPPASAADIVVTPAWLAAHLKDPDLVILQVGDKESYDRGHVPGARYLDFRQLSDPAAKLRLQMPSAERLRDLFESFGVSDASRIVIYFPAGSPTAAARTFVSLDYLGLGDRASILDGGQAAWTAAGQALSTDVSTPARGRITVAPHPDVVVDGAYVQAHLKDPGVQIIDARNHEYYTGEKSASMPRDGHIAGATNIPFDTVVDPKTTVLKDEATLRQMLQSAGASADKQLIAYCHIGQQASEVYLVARLLGYRVHLYDGSFEDWSAHPEWPIQTGEAR